MKKLSKTEKIFRALINGDILSGKTILQRFGTMKGVNRINELEKSYFFTCVRKWVKPNKNSKDSEEYYEYSMKKEDIKRFKKLIDL
jgi:hypothetical protein